MPPAVNAWSPNHWATTEIPGNPCSLVGKKSVVLPAVNWKVKGIPNFREETESKLLSLLFICLPLTAFDKILQERDMRKRLVSFGKDA